MNTLQVAIWAVSLAGLAGVAYVLSKYHRLATRLAALAGFGGFYLAVLLWGPVDQIWFGVTTASFLIIAFRFRAASSPGDSMKGRTDE